MLWKKGAKKSLKDGQVFCASTINMHYMPHIGDGAEDLKSNHTWALTPKNSQSNGKSVE